MVSKQVSGAAKQVRGSVTEALGKLSGDTVVQAKGAAQKREGEAEARDDIAPKSETSEEPPRS